MQVTLTVVKGPHHGREFVFHDHENFIVGRGPQAHFQLPELDKFFSRLHFLVEVNPPCCRLLDLNSRNGTHVNNQKVASIDLRDRDLIRAGRTLIQVRILADAESAHPSTLTTRSGSDLENRPELHSLDDLLPNHESEMPVENELLGYLPTDFPELIAQRDQPISGFDIIEEIGRGGMGVVYLAMRHRDRAVLALKTIRPAIAASSTEIQRFLREASILKELRHPNIVRFRDMGASAGLLYFAMDYVPGENAHAIQKRYGQSLPVNRAVNFVCQALEGVTYAHSMGFVHRDIKPSNLLVLQEQNREHVKLADFGLARVYEESRLSGLTMTGEVGGTVPFMPPEQITDFRHSMPPVDQYAAAATLYYLLTGKYVYDFPADVGNRLVMILQQTPIPIQQRNPDIPDQLAITIHRALARDPANRFTDAEEFRSALLRWL